jgi:hypothetical protein
MMDEKRRREQFVVEEIKRIWAYSRGRGMPGQGQRKTLMNDE